MNKNTLEIKIETENEENIFKVLQHVFREITEGIEYNNPADTCSRVENGWLVLESEILNGRYYWRKN